MRIVPARSTAVHVVSILALFLGGPAVGAWLAGALTPDSLFISVVAPFSFAFVMLAGLFVWIGAGIVTVLTAGLFRVASGKGPAGRSLEPGQSFLPPGYRGFVVVGGLVGGALGLAGGILSEAAMVPALTGWLAGGLGYGGLLCAAAHNGFLPFPDDD